MFTLHSISDIKGFVETGDHFREITVNDDSIDIRFERRHIRDWRIGSIFRSIVESAKILCSTFDYEAVTKLWAPMRVEQRTARVFTNTLPPKINSDDVRALFECRDSQSMLTHITNKMPQLLDLIKIMQELPRRHIIARNDLNQVLHVLLGLKPVLALEPDSSNTAKNIIVLTAPFFPHVRFIQKDQNFCFLVNEAPLPQFDPRAYIRDFDKEYRSIGDAVAAAFPSSENQKADQLLSYLLGFGPSWEAYMLNTARLYPYTPYENRDIAIFSDKHYLQLGKSLAKGKESSDSEYIQQGKDYHGRLSELYKEAQEESKKLTKSERLQRIKASNAQFKKIYSLNMDHVADEVSYATDYIQAGIAYRERLQAAFTQ